MNYLLEPVRDRDPKRLKDPKTGVWNKHENSKPDKLFGVRSTGDELLDAYIGYTAHGGPHYHGLSDRCRIWTRKELRPKIAHMSGYSGSRDKRRQITEVMIQFMFGIGFDMVTDPIVFSVSDTPAHQVYRALQIPGSILLPVAQTSFSTGFRDFVLKNQGNGLDVTDCKHISGYTQKGVVWVGYLNDSTMSDKYKYKHLSTALCKDLFSPYQDKLNTTDTFILKRIYSKIRRESLKLWDMGE